MMRSITVKYTASGTDYAGESMAGAENTWACNEGGRGVFILKANGDWSQRSGTCDTPTFRDPAKFRDYLRKVYGVSNARTIAKDGWP